LALTTKKNQKKPEKTKKKKREDEFMKKDDICKIKHASIEIESKRKSTHQVTT
jgi:hypothetical protein